MLSRGDFSLIFKQGCERDVSALTQLALLQGFQVCPLEVSVGCLASRMEQNVSLMVQVKAQWLRQACTVTPLGLMLGVKDI